MATGRTGRRPGESGTRAAILRAASELFAQQGFERTSVRQVAREADVDPALVAHYFGSKAALFVAVTRPPEAVGQQLPGIVAGDRESVGRRVAELVVGQLEDEDARARILGLVRAAATEPAAAAMVREVIVDQVLGPVAHALELDRPELRTALVGSQVVGMVMARHVVGLPPLVPLGADELVRLLTPVLQHWFTEPL